MAQVELSYDEILMLTQMLDNTPVKGVNSMVSVIALVKKLEEATINDPNIEREHETID